MSKVRWLVLCAVLLSTHASAVLSQRSQNESHFGAQGFANLGIFDATADWGSPESPPQRGQFKVPGRVGVSGSGEYLVYDLYGNWDDIWDNNDEGFFVYAERAGSWTLTARMEWLDRGQDDNAWALGFTSDPQATRSGVVQIRHGRDRAAPTATCHGAIAFSARKRGNSRSVRCYDVRTQS